MQIDILYIYQKFSMIDIGKKVIHACTYHATDEPLPDSPDFLWGPEE